MPTVVENMTDEDLLRMEQRVLDQYRASSPQKPMRTLFRMCRGYYGQLFISAVFCALQLSASLYLPIAMANIVDAITIHSADCLQTILINLGISVLLLAINLPMQYLYQDIRNDAVRSIDAALRGAIVTKLQHLTIRFSKAMESGRIQSKIIRDVESIHTLITSIHTTGVHIIVNMTTVIVMLLIKGNIPMMLFFAICGPIAALVAKRFKKRIRQKNHEYRCKMEETTARVNDMVNLIPVTKAHALENVEITKMSHDIESSSRVGFQMDTVMSRFVVTNWLVMQVFHLLCLALGAFLAFTGKASVGDVTLYLSYFSTFVAYINSISNLIPTISSGAEAVSSIDEILGSADIEDNTGKVKLPRLRGEYRFSNVGFRYEADERKILDGLTLEVHAGETVALVGESGSGKSTIINLVTGFYFCDEGQVLIDGQDIRTIDLKSYRKQIAVVLQNSILFNGSIRDNITYGIPHVSEKRLQQVIDEACLRDVLADLPQGLDTPVGELGNRLSGGQRQRISIARALIRNPRIIVLDEATSALDTVSEKHIQTAIDNLARDKTTFIVAHRLSTVKNADKIAVIADGHCVEFGTYNELLDKKGAFYQFRQMQI